MPTGNDAGDLTRTIQYAISDDAKARFPGRQLMFPDDLIELKKIIGPTLITQQHRDKDTVKRYRKLYETNRKRKNRPLLKDRLSVKQGQKGRSSGKQRWPEFDDYSSSDTSLLPEETPPPGSPQISETSHSSVPLSPFSGPVKNRSKLKPLSTHMSLKTPDSQPERDQMSQSVPALDLNDNLPPQDEVEEVIEIDAGVATTSPDEQAYYEQYWERLEGERQRAMDESIHALQNDLGIYVPSSRFTGEDYEDLFGESAPN